MRAAFHATPPVMSAAPASAGALYAARCVDFPGLSATRAANRAAHLEWIAAQDGFFHFAGPLRPAPGVPPIGSLLIMHAAAGGNADAVRGRLQPDPYAKAGLFESVEVRQWVCGMASEPPLPESLFAVWCVDRSDARALRKETRPAHLDWWRSAGRKGMIGPFPAEDGDGAVGSLIVCEGDSLEEVKEWAATDPYNKAGLFENVFVSFVTKVVEDGKMLEVV